MGICIDNSHTVCYHDHKKGTSAVDGFALVYGYIKKATLPLAWAVAFLISIFFYGMYYAHYGSNRSDCGKYNTNNIDQYSKSFLLLYRTFVFVSSSVRCTFFVEDVEKVAILVLQDSCFFYFK